MTAYGWLNKMGMIFRVSLPEVFSVDGSVSCDNIEIGELIEKNGSVYLPRSRPRFVVTVDHGSEPPLPESVTGSSPSAFSALVYSGFIRGGTKIACILDSDSGLPHGHAGIYVVLSSDSSAVVVRDDAAGQLLIGGEVPIDGDYDVFLFADPAYGADGVFAVHGLP